LLEGYLYKKCPLSSDNLKIDQGGEPKIMKEIHNKAGLDTTRSLSTDWYTSAVSNQ